MNALSEETALALVASLERVMERLASVEARLAQVEERQSNVSDNQGRAWLATVDLKHTVQRFMDKQGESK